MSFDISGVMDKWPYEPGQVMVRRFKGKDGLEKIQLRVDLGVLQMNAEGRPDGRRPMGHPSWLEHHRARLARHREEHGGSETGFAVGPEDCSRIQQEAIQYHHRYICLFQLEDYQAVLRDTMRNLEAFDFVAQYAASEELGWSLQQFRPQLLMMRTRALGMLAIREKDFPTALTCVERGIEELRDFYRAHERMDLLDQSGEIESLEGWLEDLRTQRPLSAREKLERALAEAVQVEDYERAAKVRDALRKLESLQP